MQVGQSKQAFHEDMNEMLSVFPPAPPNHTRSPPPTTVHHNPPQPYPILPTHPYPHPQGKEDILPSKYFSKMCLLFGHMPVRLFLCVCFAFAVAMETASHMLLYLSTCHRVFLDPKVLSDHPVKRYTPFFSFSLELRNINQQSNKHE